MKRIVLIMLAFTLFIAGVNAQKTVIKTERISDTQARMLEVTAKSYVRPLVVDLVVAKGQACKKFKRSYTIEEYKAMGGSHDNLRSRVIYEATSDAPDAWNCDAVVAATFKIEVTPEGAEVEMKGFPANFNPNSWHNMEEKDFEWMKVDRAISFDKINDPDREGAVITHIKK